MELSFAFKPPRQDAVYTQELATAVASHLPQLQHALVGDLSYIHGSARLREPVVIDGVMALGSNRFQLNYHFQWEIFNACLAMDMDDTIHATLQFDVADDGMVTFVVADSPAS